MTTNVISIKTRKTADPSARRQTTKIPEDIFFALGAVLTIALPEGIFAAAYGGLASFAVFIATAVVGCAAGLAMYRRSNAGVISCVVREETPRAPSTISGRLKNAA